MEEPLQFAYPLVIRYNMTAEESTLAIASLVASVKNNPVIPPESKPVVVDIVEAYCCLTPGGVTTGIYLAKNFYLALCSILDKHIQQGDAIPRLPDVGDGPPVPLIEQQRAAAGSRATPTFPRPAQWDARAADPVCGNGACVAPGRADCRGDGN
jgi:hypothetical protein